ncbi:hypothetical protein [Oribacterium sp.]
MTIGKVAVEDIARRHIEFIKSGGEKGCSITPSLLKAFEKIEESYPNVLGTLRAEYYFIEALARAMKEEIERMEEES